jgi:hypothetical protein
MSTGANTGWLNSCAHSSDLEILTFGGRPLCLPERTPLGLIETPDVLTAHKALIAGLSMIASPYRHWSYSVQFHNGYSANSYCKGVVFRELIETEINQLLHSLIEFSSNNRTSASGGASRALANRAARLRLGLRLRSPRAMTCRSPEALGPGSRGEAALC